VSRRWLVFPRNAIPFVFVRIGASRYLAMVDTGAHISMVSPELAIRLGLPRQGQQPIISVHGNIINRPLVTLPSLGFAKIELAPCRAVVSDLSPIKPRLDLLLGVNLFADRRLQIDFREGRIYVLE
jgi:predicted aspartyl protease